jgi:hypothetical protein
MVGEAILGHQFNDVRAAQRFLAKQAGWLDVVYMTPGLILDSESSADTKSTAAVRLHDGSEPPGPISYARLAAAMQQAAADSQWTGKFATPWPTTNVSKGIRHFGGPLEIIQSFATRKIVPTVFKTLAWVVVGAGIGYVLGSRDGGAWSLRIPGMNVRG